MENTPYGSRTPSLQPVNVFKKARGSPLRELDNSTMSIDDTARFDTLDLAKPDPVSEIFEDPAHLESTVR